MILATPVLDLKYVDREIYEKLKRDLLGSSSHKVTFFTQFDDKTLTVRVWRRDKPVS